MNNIDELKIEYDKKAKTHRFLLDEVEFIVKTQIEKSNVKIHSVTSRVKDLSSLIKKAASKEIQDPLAGIRDFSGTRIVCLFKSDLSIIDKIISEMFNVIDKDDKVDEWAGHGYMSVHYICEMKNCYSGPRYEDIKNHVFEIQLRTLSMDAWAAVSHYLEAVMDLWRG